MIKSSLKLQSKKIKLLVLGAGGNGSAFIQTALYRVHQFLTSTGSNKGFEVIIADGSDVSQTNVLRSSFWAQDVGENKAQLIASRMNGLGLNCSFDAIPKNLSADEIVALDKQHSFDFIVSCVDVAELRVKIHDAFVVRNNAKNRSLYFLDLGNETDTGQVVLGQLLKPQGEIRIPTVVDLFPELRTIKTDNKRSCSAEESFNAQGVLVNQQCAILAGRLLTEFLTKPQIEHQGYMFNLESGSMNKMMANENSWLMRGFKHPELCSKAA